MTNQRADLKGFSRHGALPVGLVTEHSPEVTNNVHNTEYEATRTKQDTVFEYFIGSICLLKNAERELKEQRSEPKRRRLRTIERQT